jgi:undecaprenyl-diphosphatase
MVSVKNKCVLILCFFVQLIIGQNTDLRILKTINRGAYPHWDNAMLLTSASVYGIMPISFGTALAEGYYKNDKVLIRNGYRGVANLFIAGGITTTLKYFVNRTRPFKAYPADIVQRDKGVGPYSFPSGHTTFAFASATNLCLTYKKWYITVPAYVYASMVGYSRMRLGVHYPSDVLVGAIIGIGSGLFVWKMDEIWLKKKKSKVIIE